MDFKLIVKEAYLAIIKGALDRVVYFEVDDSINHLLRLIVVDPPQADEKLLISDKFYLYRLVWQAVLETLYQEFLPLTSYQFTWELEVTPYTMLLCELTQEHAPTVEMEHLQKLMGLTDEQIEEDFESVVVKAGLDKMGLDRGLEGRVPAALLPATRKEQMHLLFRLMNFPPLTELALFQNRYNGALRQQLERLAIPFTGIKKSSLETFGMPESLRYSYFPVDHKLFNQHGFSSFEQAPALASFKQDFLTIRRLADQNKGRFKDDILCPCCGERTTIELPEEVLHYKYLNENKPLAIAIGLLHFQEFKDNFLQQLSEHLQQFLPALNRVDNPECLILVEGDSEEVAIPLLAFRKRFVLSQHSIQVFNSKSKEKLEADFLSFRTKYPNRKMICLLDSDAKKERANIERIVKDNKHKYRLVFIESGTFEDLFDLQQSVDILNELYPDGEEITTSDFDATKDFLTNLKRLMHHKKRAQFDKVLFARTISLRLDIGQMPKAIQEILDVAKDFTRETQFVKN